ncbi:MAG TPA: hypothetical protein VMY77_03030, partial [Chitinophagaceae bacterium]|nr:hypothetical protein [Chitinophagaceae bacterium]
RHFCVGLNYFEQINITRRHNQKIDCHHQLFLFVKSIICNANMSFYFNSAKFYYVYQNKHT